MNDVFGVVDDFDRSDERDLKEVMGTEGGGGGFGGHWLGSCGCMVCTGNPDKYVRRF